MPNRILEWSLDRDPCARPVEFDLFTRWPTGSRIILTPRGLGSALVVVGAILLVVCSKSMGFGPSLAVGVFGAVVVAAGSAWFVPIGSIVQVPASEAFAGMWVVVDNYSGMANSVSAVIVVKPGQSIDGGVLVGCQNGSCYSAGPDGKFVILEVTDPFERLRRSPAITEPPEEAEYLPDVCQSIAANLRQINRRAKQGAESSVVRADLRGLGLESREIDRAIYFGIRLGAIAGLEKEEYLTLTDAGSTWSDVVNVPHDDVERSVGEVLDEGTRGDPVLTRRDVLEALTEALGATGTQTTVTADNFLDWASAMFALLKHQVEGSSLIEAFWTRNDGAQDERAVQAVMHMFFRAYCGRDDVDVSKEPNAGNGPVDFKFSRGWSWRLPVEIKLMSNSKLYNGARVQLPAYMQGEQVNHGFLLCVGFTDAEIKRYKKVEEECNASGLRLGIDIRCVLIDARRRASGGHLKPASRGLH